METNDELEKIHSEGFSCGLIVLVSSIVELAVERSGI